MPSCGCCGEVGRGRLALAGLEVDDDEPAVAVALEAVDPAAEHGVADRRRRSPSRRRHAPAAPGCRVSHVSQALEHRRRAGLLVVGEPGCAEVDGVPHRVQLTLELLERLVVGGVRGEVVHQRAERRRRRPRRRARRAAASACAVRRSRNDSTRDGLTRTGRSGSATAASVDSGARPHQSSGSAPRTPAAASRASSAAAARRSPARTVSGSAQTTARSSATSPGRWTPRIGGAGGRGASTCRRGSSSSSSREGCSSSPATAVTTRCCARAGRRDVEQPAFLGELRVQRSGAADVDAAHRVDECLGAEQRPAAAQVRPAALLHAGDAHEIPFQALARVRGQDRDGGRLRARAVRTCRRGSAGRARGRGTAAAPRRAAGR